MTGRLLACIVLMATSASRVACAQTLQDPYGRIFDQVIERPTGDNGYEELVMAGVMLKANEAYRQIDILPPPGPPLSLIRKTLEQPEIARVRSLLRQGLAKAVRSPRARIDDETIFPEFQTFRQLARMLSFQLYLDFADSRASRAIDTLQNCLRFGYVVQTDTLISGLVGIAVDIIAIHRFEGHLEMLGAADCDRLLAVVREWLRWPDPSSAVLSAERQFMAALLQKYRTNPDKLIDDVSADPDSEEYRKAPAVRAMFRGNPGAAKAIFDQAGARMDAHFDRLMTELRKHPWERRDLPSTEDETPAGKLCGLLDNPNLGSSVMDRYTREQAEVQLLGVYAAVRRFRWENQTLPMSLAQLNLGAVAIDPFTGQPFAYKVLDEKDFELSSAGPVDRSKESPTAGKRMPVVLPLKKP